MNGNPPNQALIQILTAPTPTTIEEVIDLMQRLDTGLSNNDGLKWFNKLYLLVTESVLANPPVNGWNDPVWITHLDVVFANLYFSALASLVNDDAIPSSWNALFEARNKVGIDRIQFALAGMNAHINHDLPFALVQTNSELQLDPNSTSPEHDDFEDVNNLLEAVLPEALKFLATGIAGEAAQDTGKIGRILAMWSVRQARNTAWENATILRATESLPLVHRRFIAVLDKVTGLAGRGLLLPIQ